MSNQEMAAMATKIKKDMTDKQGSSKFDTKNMKGKEFRISRKRIITLSTRPPYKPDVHRKACQ